MILQQPAPFLHALIPVGMHGQCNRILKEKELLLPAYVVPVALTHDRKLKTSYFWALKALVICHMAPSLPNTKPPKKQQQPRNETFQIVHSQGMDG